MPLTFNIRHLEEKEALLRGDLAVADLELEGCDELIHARQPLRYDLRAERIGQAILVQGRLEMVVDCECARCLKPFHHSVVLDPWTAHLPLDGPEAVPIKDDLADLTPFLREDILLEYPQHPLCGTDCGGLPNRTNEKKATGAGRTEASSAWSELNKLKF
jgi:uncharacterized protein